MKKFLLIIPLLLSLFSCSSTRIITAKYMDVKFSDDLESFYFIEPETEYTLTFEFEVGHEITDEDYSNMRIEMGETPFDVRGIDDYRTCYGYSVIQGPELDLEGKESFSIGYVVTKDIVIYYGILGC